MHSSDRHVFTFSQNSFSGSLACNTIATLTACSFADGEIIEDNFKKYCRVGAEMWKKVTGGSNKTSAKQILDNWEFFHDTYKIEEYQAYGSKPKAGRISLNDLIETIQRENEDRSVGIVITDGCVSFAVGKFNKNWVVFDSHAPNAWIQKTSSDKISEHILKNLVLPSVFDATTIIIK